MLWLSLSELIYSIIFKFIFEQTFACHESWNLVLVKNVNSINANFSMHGGLPVANQMFKPSMKS